jgi:catechol 2,3-dioxygenase-like lactoylglutathione lyase family enzyme
VAGRGTLHHVELWVADLAAAEASLGWLLEQLGWVPERSWPQGRSWRLGETYVVLESGPDVVEGTHDRRRPGLNHLAFSVPTGAEVDALVAAAGRRGWSLLFADRHPHAGGPEHYAAYLEDAAGFEVELVAETW